MLQIEMSRLTANLMSRSVTSTGLNGAYLLQIETNRSAESKTTTKVPVPFVVAGLPA